MIPRERKREVRVAALGAGIVALILSIWLYFSYDVAAGGYQFGGGGNAPSASAQMSQAKMASDQLLTMMVDPNSPNAKMINDTIQADADMIKLLAGAGRFEEVQVIIEKYIGRNPDNAAPPRGARELADKEDTTAVSPTGGKYRVDPETGDLVYTG